MSGRPDHEETKERILDWLERGPAMVRQLRKGTGASEVGVILALEDLERDGMVAKFRDVIVTWELTEKGMKR